jgi:hypothetical protein
MMGGGEAPPLNPIEAASYQMLGVKGRDFQRPGSMLINETESNEIERYVSREPFLITCISKISSTIFGDGKMIEIETPPGFPKPTYEKDTAFMRQFQMFADECLYSILKFGYVVYYQTPTTRKTTRPEFRVAPYNSYTLTRSCDPDITGGLVIQAISKILASYGLVHTRKDRRKHVKKMKIGDESIELSDSSDSDDSEDSESDDEELGGERKRKHELVEQKNPLRVFLTTKWAPGIDGRYHSKISSLLPTLQRCSDMLEADINATIRNSNPVFFLEARSGSKDDSAFPGTNAITMTSLGRRDVTAQHVANLQVNDEMQRKRVVAEINSIQEDLATNPANVVHRYNHMTGKSDPIYKLTKINPIPIPNGFAIVHPPPAQQPRDSLAWQRQKEEEICSVLGVPRAVISSSSVGNIKNDVVGYGDVISANIVEYKEILCMLLEDALFGIYKELSDEYGTEADERERLLNRIHTVNPFKVRFNTTTMLSKENIDFLGTRGFISQKTEGTYYANSFGVPEKDIENNPKPRLPPEIAIKQAPKNNLKK